MDDIQPLRELFDKIDANELAAMRDRREEESFNLDFKRMNTGGEPDDADKRNLREAISGFANSAGGIVLWGVESKSSDDRRDRSRFQSLVPVANGDRAAVRFHELTATATQPPVSGVTHKAIAVEGGFVVKTFVPASDGGPHRTGEEKGQYFRRDADAFRAMQHHEIADMFGRRARPRLEIVTRFLPEVELQARTKWAWVLVLRNVGRGIARFPCVSIRTRQGFPHFGVFAFLDGKYGLTYKIVSDPNVQSIVFAGGANDVVHPEQEVDVARICLAPNRTQTVILADFRLFAEGMPATKGAFRFGHFGIKLGDGESEPFPA